MAATASAGVIDFTNVKDGGNFNTKRQPEGDYRAKVTNVVDAQAKDGVAQWLFTIQVGTGTYPYYCKHMENQYWKIRNLLVAAGMNVPKKKVKVDPNKLVGKSIAVTLEDDEYEGKMKSVVAATFPLSELDDDNTPDEPDDEDGDDGDEDEAPVTKKKKAAPVEDDEDDVEEETDVELTGLDAMDRTELKELIRDKELDIRVAKSMSDDDIRNAIRALDASAEAEEEEDDEEEEPAPKAKKKAAPKPADDDDDLEEIDIDD